MGLDNVDVWFQDEARFGQQNTTTRLWTERSSRPRVVKQQQFEYACLFGSVCPARGIGEAMVVPWVNKNIMDGAGWHTNDIAEPFDNVSIIKLPPYSPELSPIE
ncbi:IS630 family transposase, partial [Vibrio vulnificus]|nr:IS630 family transposase [Vibrio vulnificus]ELV8614071.1 IS630 family transposase [Vibrio vulnificus]